MPSTLDVEVDSTNSTNSTTSRSSASRPDHPRRVSAKESVTLVHGREPRARTHSPTSPSAPQTRPHLKRPSSSPSSLKPHIGKDDSGESSNAERWFEKSNNHASRNSTSFVDNSPPFFLQNSSSDETPPNAETLSRNPHLLGVPSNSSLPMRAGLLHLGTDNSSTEDFRSVIDDLTIENKKLKRKLKGYQKLQDSHLKDQKLFEVRFHSLSTNKKRELEEVLRRFALGLNGMPGAESMSQSHSHSQPSAYNSVPLNVPASMPNQKSGSSSTSQPFNDSAYASGSGSGQGSSGLVAGQTAMDNKKKHSSSSSTRTRHHNMSIQSFLHDIPEGLLPKQIATMSDKAKKKLIVRRLEQIFAGKGAAAGNQQAGQQQEVSQLAAKADRHMYYQTHAEHAPKEGLREAHIMQGPQDAKSRAEVAAAKGVPLTRDSLAKAGLEQRPTRPLDLDLYRAQVPSENYKYMKHLGFSPPGTDITEPYQDGHGWIYLNLLANMAQLHTISVTPEFMRKAIQDYSKRFELSEDGRKIRWKGGQTVTKTSSDGDASYSVTNSGSGGRSSERGSPRKRLKMSEHDTSESGSKPSSGLTMELKAENKLAYTPLFYHRSSNDSDVSSDEDEDENTSPFPIVQAGDSSGMTSSGIKTTSSKRKGMRDTGPIIFYNNAKFCTDLSADSRKEDAMLYNAYLYHSVAQEAVGVPASGSSSPLSEAKGPLTSGSELPEAMDLVDNPIPKEAEVLFPDQSPLSSQSAGDLPRFDFEVSGLGGVCPADNFTINVTSMHARIDDVNAPTTGEHPVPARYPERISGILKEDKQYSKRNARTAFHKVLETKHEVMPPSRLPDASCFMTAGDTSPEDEDMSDAESEMPISADAPAPSAAPQMMDLDYMSTSESEDDDDYESDGSLDLLATAREVDPEAIRAREMEYDAEMADRLAEDIPAGSSAATAGGGSGFASPASNVDRAEYEAAKLKQREAKEKEKQDKIDATKH